MVRQPQIKGVAWDWGTCGRVRDQTRSPKRRTVFKHKGWEIILQFKNKSKTQGLRWDELKRKIDFNSIIT